jgi:hypothetical protein
MKKHPPANREIVRRLPSSAGHILRLGHPAQHDRHQRPEHIAPMPSAVHASPQAIVSELSGSPRAQSITSPNTHGLTSLSLTSI